MTPVISAGAQLEELTSAVQQRREVIEASQEALPVALQLALQLPEGTPSAIDSRHVIFHRASTLTVDAFMQHWTQTSSIHLCFWSIPGAAGMLYPRLFRLLLACSRHVRQPRDSQLCSAGLLPFLLPAPQP